MINILSEQPFTLRQIAALLPGSNNRPVSYFTVWRWARGGHKGVQLETMPLGRRLVTSMEAVQRFMEALASKDAPTPPVRTARSQSEVDRRLMEKHGI
jgi:hypothetical protein